MSGLATNRAETFPRTRDPRQNCRRLTLCIVIDEGVDHSYSESLRGEALCVKNSAHSYTHNPTHSIMGSGLLDTLGRELVGSRSNLLSSIMVGLA